MHQIVNIVKSNTPLQLRVLLRKLNWKVSYYLQTLFIIKKEYYCPINEKEYKQFVKKKNMLISPDLGARERHRFIWHYLKSSTNLLNDGKKLLHVSPEYCFYKKFVKNKRKNYYPVDKFEPGYDYLELTQNFDLLSINEKEEYDYIICNHVLEHILDDGLAIENLYTLLKKGGIAFVSVPIRKNNLPTYEDSKIVTLNDRKKYFGQWDHVRHYGLDIVDRFTKVGFEVKVIDSSDYFSKEEQNKFGVVRTDYLFELTKPAV